MISRRKFLLGSLLSGASLLLPKSLSKASPNMPFMSGNKAVQNALKVAIPGGTLNPLAVPKYATPLVIPPAMPITSVINDPRGRQVDYYEIAVRQFMQRILPAGLPTTKVWGYGSVNHPGTFNYPSFTIEATVNRPVRVKWMNQLVDNSGHYLPHLLPVDPTLHWANPAGPRDTRPTFTSTPGPYTGPVPMVTHVHGAHADEQSDGYAEAWYLPDAVNIPDDYFDFGSRYAEFKAKAEASYGQVWEPGTSVFQYDNDQNASSIWYHDHTLGMTRLNVYAGPAGFYLLRGGSQDLPGAALPGPAPKLGDTPGTHYYEIPLAIQDRSFNADGSLFYPSNREFFDGFTGPYIPDTDLSPIWNPEFFGNMMLVNGNTWPVLHVEARPYRLRLLNGCNSRTLMVRLVTGDPTTRPGISVLPFLRIGAEGGFLKAPVEQDRMLMMPAERADTIVDFTGIRPGTIIYLINEGPDEPYGGGIPGLDFAFADPQTTGQIMKIVVGERLSPLSSLIKPSEITLPSRPALPATDLVRRVGLGEEESHILPGVGPLEAVLGTVSLVNGTPVMTLKKWMDDPSETPLAGSTEVWEIYNFTIDGHPIHIHQVMFEVVNRESMATHAVRPPEAWETGLKDTVVSLPGEITRVKARFSKPGLYVWHCHIVEHEDNEMMRPFRVLSRANIPFLANSGS